MSGAKAPEQELCVTTSKRDKRRVRDRMARTGESYSEALRQCGYEDLIETAASIEAPQTAEGNALQALIVHARARYRP